MNFKHNFSEFYLLTNKPIEFINDSGDKFKLFLPTVEDIYTNGDLAFYIQFIQLDLDEIQKWIAGLNYKIESHYDFILLISALSGNFSEVEKIKNRITSSIRVFLPEFYIKDKLIYVKTGISLSPTLFNTINEIIFKSLGKELVVVSENDDPFIRMEKQQKLRAQKIRSGKKLDGKENSVNDMIIAILYEYQQYKIEDIMKMNIYTFNYLFKYIGKIANYEVSKIAMGNGNTKKHKYFIEK